MGQTHKPFFLYLEPCLVIPQFYFISKMRRRRMSEPPAGTDHFADSFNYNVDRINPDTAFYKTKRGTFGIFIIDFKKAPESINSGAFLLKQKSEWWQS
jgi:hypothetical protein